MSVPACRRRVRAGASPPAAALISGRRCKLEKRFEVRNAIVDRKDLSIGARLLYLALDSRSWKDGSCEATQSQLAAGIGTTARNIRRWLVELRTAGQIVSARTGSGCGYVMSWALEERSRASDRKTRRADTGVRSDRTQASAGGQRIKVLGVSTDTTSIDADLEWVKLQLEHYPGARHLPLAPDRKICARVWEAACCNRDGLSLALQEMHKARKSPRTSWAWFPVVVDQYRAQGKRPARAATSAPTFASEPIPLPNPPSVFPETPGCPSCGDSGGTRHRPCSCPAGHRIRQYVEHLKHAKRRA